MIRRFAVACAVVAIGSIAGGIYAASIEPVVYDAPRFYRIERFTDAEGVEKVRIDATVVKRLSCDLESGSGPVWVDFYGSDPAPTTLVERVLELAPFRVRRDPVPPSSALFRATGEVAGETRLQAGESMLVRGYTATVPPKLAGLAGEFNVRVPCQRWEPAGDGTKAWGRQIVATWGPMPLPLPGRTVTDSVPLIRREDR